MTGPLALNRRAAITNLAGMAAMPAGVIDPTRLGAVDDTAAFERALALATEAEAYVPATMPDAPSLAGGGAFIFVPPGVYELKRGLNASTLRNIVLIGVDANLTQIVLPDEVDFLHFGSINSLRVEGLRFVGGRHVFCGDYPGIEVRRNFRLQDCQFFGFTGCAVRHISRDMPNWRIERCEFWPSLPRDPKGIAVPIMLSGWSDEAVIDGCSFFGYSSAVVLAKGGNNVHIARNFFGGARDLDGADVVIGLETEDPIGDNSGHGLRIIENKFGNEGSLDDTIRIQFAEWMVDERGVPRTLTRPSKGWATGAVVAFNNFLGRGRPSRGLIVSRTRRLSGLLWFANNLSGSVHPYAIEFLVDPDDAFVPTQNTVIFNGFDHWDRHGANRKQAGEIIASNLYGATRVVDWTL